MTTPNFSPGNSASVVSQDLLLAGLLLSFMLQMPMVFRQFHPTSRGWRQVAYRGALAARMTFIVLLVRELFALFGQ